MAKKSKAEETEKTDTSEKKKTTKTKKKSEKTGKKPETSDKKAEEKDESVEKESGKKKKATAKSKSKKSTKKKTSEKSTDEEAKPSKADSEESKKDVKKKSSSAKATEGQDTKSAKETESTEASDEKADDAAGKVDPDVEPETMEQLLEVTGYEISAPQPGEVIDGVVTDISRKMLLVDIGAKTEGMVVDKEFDAASDFIEELSVGDEVNVYVLTPENERGQILLSLKRALVDKKWQQFEEYLETGQSVEVRGLEVNKGGMIVSAGGIRGFVPSSQFGKDYLGQMEKLLDDTFKVKVIEVDKEKNRLIFSERHVSEAEEIARKSKALSYVEEDEVYEGVVSGIMPFGAFVGVEIPFEEDGEEHIGKIEGLVHISEISWEKVDDPNDYFKLGDRVKVKVLGIDEDAGKLNLSVKQLSSDPWDDVPEKYPEGAKVRGEITRTAPFGAFVTLEPGVDGLIHISKIPAGEEPKLGEEVEVFVESIDPEQRRMSLGMMLQEVPVAYK